MTTNGTRGSILTHKQASLLFKFTLLKFWEPEQTPPPTVAEASKLIGACMEWMRAKGGEHDILKAQIVGMVRAWFPDWTGENLKPRFGRRKASGEYHPEETEKKETPGSDSKNELFGNPPEDKHAEHKEPEQEHETEEQETGKEEEPAAGADNDETVAIIVKRIRAGMKNLFLYGPAGCGKTTICRDVAARLELPCTILSCNSGTSPAEIVGFKYPEPRPSPVSRAIGSDGLIVFDEFTTLDPSVASVANALLANNELETSTGHVKRAERCIIIATANTTGQGADRLYISNNKLDAATLDRFTCGFISVNYSAEYEKQFQDEVRDYCEKLRRIIANNRLERVISTRAIIAGDMMRRAGLDWKRAIVETWSDAERALIGG